MNIEVSVGEVVDKFSILELKLKYIKNEVKIDEIKKEIEVLKEANKFINNNIYFYRILLHINEEIWLLTDIIKILDLTNPEFSKKSNEIFELNQKRFRIKNFFNIFHNSNIKEQKSYSINHCIIEINNLNTFEHKIPEINYLSINYDTISFDCNFIDNIKSKLNIPTIIYEKVENCVKRVNLKHFELDEQIKKIFSLKIINLDNSPNLGIGDLLLLKNICINNNFDIKYINISTTDICRWKCDPQKYLIFIEKFIKFLFPYTIINFGNYESRNYLLEYINNPFNSCYIFNNLNPINMTLEYDDYIIFHTKVRIDNFGQKFIDEDISKLNNFFDTFHTNKKILILGERELENNIEVNIHKIVSIYNNLLLLKKNNNVIDLSKDNLCSGNFDFNDFIKDIALINKAYLNITFGIGGPFNLCQSFSKNSLCYISNFNDPKFMIYFDYYNKINNNMYRDIESFVNKITELC